MKEPKRNLLPLLEGIAMNTGTTRRAALATIGTGIAGATLFGLAAPKAALAAMSSAAGVIAGGSLDGPNGPVQFSIFASRLEFDDAPDPVIQGAFAWYDPAGLDGEPLTLQLVSLASYGKSDQDNTRFMSGTVSVNGEGEEPFGVFLTDMGTIGSATDNIQLAVGPTAAGITGTPVVESESGFAYEVAADLTSGDVQLIKLV
jgi:hypothetical protein